MHSGWVQLVPSRHKSLTQCCIDVGPPSPTLAQHQYNIVSISAGVIGGQLHQAVLLCDIKACVLCLCFLACHSKVRCQRKSFVCGQGDTECLFAPLFYAIHLLSLPSNLQIPADLFTMHVQYNPYRRFEFELVLNSAQDPTTGEVRVTKDFFQLKSRTDYQAVLQLLRNIDGPQDVELQINMNVYSVEFENDEEKFLGTAVAKIKLFITKAPWE